MAQSKPNSNPIPRAVVVNDSPTQLNILVGLLQKAGMQPIPFDNAEAALGHMQPDAPPDLIVTDLYMPGIDGWRFCRLLRSPAYPHLNHVPILVVSATFSGDEPSRISSDLGANAFLSMPVDGQNFIDMVQALLKGEITLTAHDHNVLIVEDSQRLSKRLQKAFEAHGYQVDAAHTYQEGLTLIAQAAYDVAILEYHLPDGLGDNLMKFLQEKSPDCICMMLSAEPHPELALDWMKMGAADYLQKPFEPEYLIAKCERARRERALLRIQELLDVRTRQLQDSQAIYRLIADNMAETISVLDLKTLRFTYISPSLMRLLGYTAEEGLQHSLEIILTPTSLQLALQTIQQELELEATGSAAPERNRILELEEYRKDGSTCWVSNNMTFIRDEDHQPSAILIVSRDVTEHRHAQSRLMASEERFRQAMRATYDGLWDWNNTTQRIYYSPRYWQMLGYEPNELDENPQSWKNFIHPDDRRLVLAANQDCIENRTPNIHIEFRMKAKNGTWIWIQSRARAAMRDAEGRAQRMIGTHTDITRRKQAEEALRAGEERYRSLFERSIVVVADQNGICIEASPQFCELLGYRQDELVGMNFRQITHPDDLQGDLEQNERMVKGEIDGLILEKRYLHKSGEPVWINLSVIPIRDASGAILQSVGVIQNITWRKQAEAALRESEEKYRQLVETTTDWVWTIDLENKHTFSNPAIYPLLGYQVSEIIGVSAFPLVHPDDEQSVNDMLKRCIEHKAGWKNLLVRWLHKDGSVRFFESSSSPMLDTSGQLVGFSGIDHDVTIQKQAEEELVKARILLEQTFEQSPIPMVLVSMPDAVIRIVNPACRELLGFVDEPSPVNTPLLDFKPSYKDFDPQGKERTISDSPIARALSGHKTADLENMVIRKDGTIRWEIVYGTPILDVNGEIIAGYLVLLDITERKKTEQALLESQRMQSTLISNLPGFVYRCANDRNWSMVFISDGCLAVTGYAPEDFLHNQKLVYNDLVHPDYREPLWEQWQALLAQKKAFEEEYPIFTASGELRWVWERGQGIFSDDGQLNYLEGFITDITERKHAEQALRESEKRFSDMVSQSPLSIQIVDPSGKTILVNHAFEKLWGVPFEQMQGYNVLEDKQFEENGIMPYLMRAFGGEAVECPPVEYTPKSETYTGQHRVVQAIIFPIKNQFGVVREVTLIHQDVTQAKHAQDEIRRINIFLNSIIDNIPITIFLKDAHELRFLLLNRAGEELTGFSRNDLQGKNDADFVPQEQADFFMQKDRDVLLNKTPVDIPEETLQTRYQGERILHTRKLPLLDANGEPEFLLGISEDITEAKQAAEEKQRLHEQLLQAQKMESVGRLAGGVAHDFNNLLGVIIGRAETALEKVSPHQPVYQDLHEILKAGGRSANLTRQLLAFARKQPMSPIVLDLNNAVSSIFEMLRRLIGEEIDLLWHPGADLWHVLADPSQIDQVLTNLLVNSRDAITGMGEIVMETTNIVCDVPYCAKYPGLQPGDYCLLSISDNGSGMDHQTLSHLFEPFFTTKELGKGTGLGLATVFGIIKQNNGYITVASEPGQGTTFNIYLPRVDAEVELIPAFEPTGTPHGSDETILMVEDEEALLDLGKETLEGLGYQVLAAGTPAEAIQLAREHTGEIHLLITDVIMPGMNGKALAEELHATLPGLKCLFMSGYTADIISDRGVLPEGMSFIQKPFSLGDLAKRVHQILGQK